MTQPFRQVELDKQHGKLVNSAMDYSPASRMAPTMSFPSATANHGMGGYGGGSYGAGGGRSYAGQGGSNWLFGLIGMALMLGLIVALCLGVVMVLQSLAQGFYPRLVHPATALLASTYQTELEYLGAGFIGAQKLGLWFRGWVGNDFANVLGLVFMGLYVAVLAYAVWVIGEVLDCGMLVAGVGVAVLPAVVYAAWLALLTITGYGAATFRMVTA